MCFLIERELHQVITPEYSVAKFLAQAEMMKEVEDKIKAEEAKQKMIKVFGSGR